MRVRLRTFQMRRNARGSRVLPGCTLHPHVERLDVEGSRSQGILAPEDMEISIDERPVKRRIEGDEHRPAALRRPFNPLRELAQRSIRRRSSLEELGRVVQQRANRLPGNGGDGIWRHFDLRRTRWRLRRATASSWRPRHREARTDSLTAKLWSITLTVTRVHIVQPSREGAGSQNGRQRSHELARG